MADALVSIIIPVYNGEQYVQDAIASVLAQSYRDLEVIVVDDGSTDDTAQRVQRIDDLRVRYLYQANQGAALARNLGVAASRGELLAFLDADDLWHEAKLARQVALLAARPELDLVFAHYCEFLSPEVAAETRTAALARPGYSSGTMLIRRASFLRVGGFSAEWRVGEFVEWYARATDGGLQHAMMDEPFLRRRVHQRNMGVVQRAARVDYARVVRAIVERRRRDSVNEAEYTDA